MVHAACFPRHDKVSHADACCMSHAIVPACIYTCQLSIKQSCILMIDPNGMDLCVTGQPGLGLSQLQGTATGSLQLVSDAQSQLCRHGESLTPYRKGNLVKTAGPEASKLPSILNTCLNTCIPPMLAMSHSTVTGSHAALFLSSETCKLHRPGNDVIC